MIPVNPPRRSNPIQVVAIWIVIVALIATYLTYA